MNKNFTLRDVIRCHGQRFSRFKIEAPKYEHSQALPLTMITSGIATPVIFDNDEEDNIWAVNESVILDSRKVQSIRVCIYHRRLFIGCYDVEGKIRHLTRDHEVKGRFFAKVLVSNKKKKRAELAATFYQI